jgi:hypothetical protein
MKTMIRTYPELILLPTFEERFEYLRLDGRVGEDTFGLDRYLNQLFYRSYEWRKIRDYVIVRDNACDLAVEGYDIYEKVLIHHMNPITARDIANRTELLLNPEYLICVTHNTHNAIHYGDANLVSKAPVVRTKNDTCPWKH